MGELTHPAAGAKRAASLQEAGAARPPAASEPWAVHAELRQLQPAVPAVKGFRDWRGLGIQS